MVYGPGLGCGSLNGLLETVSCLTSSVSTVLCVVPVSDIVLTDLNSSNKTQIWETKSPIIKIVQIYVVMPSQEAAAAPAANWDIPAPSQTWGDDLNYTNLVPIIFGATFAAINFRFNWQNVHGCNWQARPSRRADQIAEDVFCIPHLLRGW